jgi:hypothetical protein
MTEETLFHEALAKPTGDRAAFLAATCAGNRELRAAVLALLAAHEASGAILDRPPQALDETIDSKSIPPDHDATVEHTPDPSASRSMACR